VVPDDHDRPTEVPEAIWLAWRRAAVRFRDLQLEIDLSDNAVGDLLGVTHDTVARWAEGRTAVPAWALWMMADEARHPIAIGPGEIAPTDTAHEVLTRKLDQISEERAQRAEWEEEVKREIADLRTEIRRGGGGKQPG
jgi:DNA-binding transcriptional regulator YdaS (Cro superfamily)